MTQPRLTIQWAPAAADYAADAVEPGRPDLAARLRAAEWVAMTLDDARAVRAATAHPSTPDTAEREAAWIAACAAEDDLERERGRLAHLDRIRQAGVRQWMYELDDIAPRAVAARVLGMDEEPEGGDRGEQQIRARARALGLPYDEGDLHQRRAQA